ncbi:TetR/AcrR family transcriptional regulator [Sutterella megalosphaeroides]|uniref:TetR family transcriptional regulator n=1 Tax=Sutterella megalosphaeroides TaxID=2494234 RepID=A0A2Z6IF97_9BURK|nr:TetR/AcrR family transcriptional regulator [Sutterella megalosphaeroides]BBF23436.1 TetR family transcriptional regulator [Sutterella megalosphaeroides]
MSEPESSQNQTMTASNDASRRNARNAHKRPKKPAEVRRRVLEVAEELASTAGAEGVRFSEVAKRADVTTGGIVHHFPNKHALLAAVVELLTEDMERDVDAAIERGDPAPYLVTRVYVKHALTETNARFAALMRLMLSSGELGNLWNLGLQRMLERAHPTDRSTKAYLVRCAADGLWLEGIATSGAVSDAHREAARALASELETLAAEASAASEVL